MPQATLKNWQYNGFAIDTTHVTRRQIHRCVSRKSAKGCRKAMDATHGLLGFREVIPSRAQLNCCFRIGGVPSSWIMSCILVRSVRDNRPKKDVGRLHLAIFFL